MGIVETIEKSFSEGVNLITKSPFSLLFDITKIYTLGLVFSAIGLGIFLLFVFSLCGSTLFFLFDENASASQIKSAVSSLLSHAWVISAVGVLMALVVGIIDQVIGSVVINAVDNCAAGKETVLLEKINMNFIPITLYTIFVWGVDLILLSLLLFSYILGGGGFRGLSALCGMVTVIFLFLLIFHFLLQFSYFELLLNRRGLLASLKRSFSLVKDNFLTVLIFDILYIVLVSAISTPINIAAFFVDNIGNFLLLTSGTWGLLLYGLLYALFFLVMRSILTFLSLPFFYSFWKNLAGGDIDGIRAFAKSREYLV